MLHRATLFPSGIGTAILAMGGDLTQVVVLSTLSFMTFHLVGQVSELLEYTKVVK